MRFGVAATQSGNRVLRAIRLARPFAAAAPTLTLACGVTAGSWFPPLAVLACGYGFAWVGHFFFELNKPASFVYPT